MATDELDEIGHAQYLAFLILHAYHHEGGPSQAREMLADVRAEFSDEMIELVMFEIERNNEGPLDFDLH
jgi:hypothetical protein